jgi:hypothetical protein
MSDLTKALFALYPEARWTLDGDSYDGLTWLSEDIEKPTEQKLLNWEDPNVYQYNRAEEYPLIEDQLDDIYHNGIDGWKATIKAIKDKYPKEN